MAPHEEAQANAQGAEPINTRGLRAVLIFGAAHYVCKTLVATALCREIEGRRAQRTLYLQPASGRPPDASDTSHVEQFCEATTEFIRHYNTITPDLDALEIARTQSVRVCFYASIAAQGMDAAAASDNLTSFFQNGHGNEPQVVNEEDAIGDIMSFLNRHVPEPGQDGGWLFIELLGGVMTPCFTGPPQADVYQPLGFPVVFVGSSALNGVSLTISTFESLALRGYNVIAVVMFKEETWKHYRYVEQYFRRSHPSVPVVILPALPLAWRPNAVEAVREYYNGVYASGAVSQLVSWLDAVYQ